MKIIKGLIIKDLKTIQSYKGTIIFMLFIFVGNGCLNDGVTVFLSAFIPLCFGMLAISSFSYDNLAKADKYILTLPIHKKEIVKARYSYILLFTIVGALLGFIITILVEWLKSGDIVTTEVVQNTITMVVGGLCVIMFLQAFQIPIMYKFGAEKGRIIQMIIIVAFMLSISFITTILMKFWGITLESLIAMLKDYSIVMIGIVVLLLYEISYLLSCKIYEKKEI